MASIMFRDPEHEASFSFSCYDFNSSALAVFSDDYDDEGGVNDNDKDDEYIEIELERPRATYAAASDDVSRDEELELRISFSSSVQFMEIPNHRNDFGLSRTGTVESLGNDQSEAATTPSPSSSSSLSSSSTLSCSSGETCWGPATDHQLFRTKTYKTIKRRVQFRTSNLNRWLHNFLKPLSSSSAAIIESGQVAIQTNDQLEMVSNRKATKTTEATNNNGVVMKFLIKCRSITIRALSASFLKPYQIIISPQSNGTTTGTGKKKKRSNAETLRAYQSLGKPFHRWSEQKDQKANNIACERSKVFDVNNMDAIKGVLSLGCKDKRTSNDPSFCSRNTNYSLSIQQGSASARDNSIQAAIAHCKRSFGQASEFPS